MLPTVSRNRIAFLTVCGLGVFSVSLPLFAQDSAPSSHFVFNDNFDGDIIVNEVRVPRDGEAMYTYYETLGWRGKGAGYAGLQAHPRAHNFIFSIWDHKDHTAPIRAVYRGPGTETKGFGGEGTGLKSWNFELGWSTDTWYTLVARTWPVKDHTYYGFWVRADDTKRWTHLVTMDVAAEQGCFQGGTDAFIEDWLSTGKNARTTHLRNGWKRKLDGTWFPFSGGRYSVNKWDLVEGKRSYQQRNHWNGGIKAEDNKASHYFMTAGGNETTPTTENPSKHAIARNETKPNFQPCAIIDAKTSLAGDAKLTVTWELDPTSAPQFLFRIAIEETQPKRQREGEITPAISISETTPHARSKTIDISKLPAATSSYQVRLECEDIFGGKSPAKIITIQP